MNGESSVNMSRRWRTGQKLGRTIYAIDESTPDRRCDVFLGIMDSSAVAAYIVASHNALRRANTELK